MNINLKQKLIDLNSDYDGALERFVGNVELYERFLLKFLDDNNFSSLKESLARKDLTSAFKYAHTLNGVVGNLGLTPLYATTKLIVEQLRNQQLINIEELMDILERDYQVISRIIRDYSTK